ncbi:hypothetical protein AB0L11_06185, partial [Micrococcus luteus]
MSCRGSGAPAGVLVCVGVRGSLPQLAHHTLLFTADWEDNFGRIERVYTPGRHQWWPFADSMRGVSAERQAEVAQTCP